MAVRWHNASWWVYGLAASAPCALLLLPWWITGSREIRHGNGLVWSAALVVVALGLGLTQGSVCAKQRDRARTAAVGDDVDAYPAAARALASGHTTDDAVRSAALRLGTYRVAHLAGRTVKPLGALAVGLLLIVVIAALAALGTTPAQWCLYGAVQVVTFWESLLRPLRRGRARRQLEVLQQSLPQVPAGPQPVV